MQKQPFDIDQAITRIEEAVKPYPKAAMFELFDEGFTTPFEQLAACILSIRTYDEVSLVCAQRLFALARTPQAMVQLPIAQIDAAIGQSTFHERKAPQIQAIAQRILAEFDGELPCDPAVLISFQGVGPKCAHLALGIACGEAYISVDIHVHRVTNRWGYVQAKTPEQTMAALEEKLPQGYWIDINRLLAPFGKHICTGKLPKCSACPVLAMCQQVGVKAHW
ncbi:MAG TPA: endonuclease III [Caldilinea sp.]|nr:endonuclease III [Caldilinea sp.]